MSIWRAPLSLAAQDLANNIPNFGWMIAITTSMTRGLAGIWAKEVTRSLISHSHFNLLESKENRSLYGLVTSNPSLSMIIMGIRLWETPESSMALCKMAL